LNPRPQQVIQSIKRCGL